MIAPRMRTPTVVVDDLAHTFGRTRALDGVTLRTRPGVTGAALADPATARVRLRVGR